jgi:hypothetical protein
MINSDNAIRPLGTGKYSITFAQYAMKLRKKCLALKEDLSSKSEREFSRWCSNLTWKIVPSGDGRVLGAKGAQIFRLARDSGPLLDVCNADNSGPCALCQQGNLVQDAKALRSASTHAYSREDRFVEWWLTAQKLVGKRPTRWWCAASG